MKPLGWRTTARLAAAAVSLAVVARAAPAQPGPASTEAELLAVLRGDSTEADKAITCKFLAVNGSAVAVGDLAKLLSHPRLASWSRIALEAIPGPEASAALRSAAGTLDGRLLAGVLTSLGARRDAESVPLLASRLAAANADVAAAAAWSLGQIASPEAGLLLADALAKASTPQRLDALAAAAVLCGAGLDAAGRSDESLAVYGAVRGADVSDQRRAEAIRGAIIAAGVDGIPLLVETLRSPTKRLANMAVFTARDLGRGGAADEALAAAVDEAILEEIESAAGSGHVPRVEVLVDVLAERNAGGPRATVIEALGRLLAASNPKPQRLAAIGALGRVGDAAVIGPLLAVATDDDPGIASTALAAVTSLAGAEVDRQIAARLAGGEAQHLPVLVEIVGRRRIDALEHLLPLVDHPNGDVRSAAIVALGPTVDLANLDVLIAAAILPKSDAEAAAARVAVREASVRMPDRGACAAKLAAALEEAPANSKPMLLEVIAEVGGGRALEAMAAAARSGDASLEDAATRLLGKWMTADAEELLYELATADSGGRFTIRALRGYIRIARQFPMPDGDRAAMCRKALAAARDDVDRKAVLEILVRYPSPLTLEVAEEAAKLPGLEAAASKACGEIRGKLEPVRKAD